MAQHPTERDLDNALLSLTQAVERESKAKPAQAFLSYDNFIRLSRILGDLANFIGERED